MGHAATTDRPAMKAATAIASGPVASPELATKAVRLAMRRAGLEHAGGVLLYLSADFAKQPQPAITAAARAANCMQVAGCTAAGLFTEEDWRLDSPAAAALVLGEGAQLRQALPDDTAWRCCLAAPNAIDTGWLTGGGRRFGGVSGDVTGRGPYVVWSGGRLAAGRRCDLVVDGGGFQVDVSRGIQPLGPPLPIDRIAGHKVLAIGGRPAYDSLMDSRSGSSPERGDPSWFSRHQVMAGIAWGEPESAVQAGRYSLLPILAASSADRSVTLASRLEARNHLFWAIREPGSAERDMGRTLDRMLDGQTRTADFALAFACMGRVPAFDNRVDSDIEQITRRLPGLPLLGFYGNNEFAWVDGGNRVLQYSTVLALYRSEGTPDV